MTRKWPFEITAETFGGHPLFAVVVVKRGEKSLYKDRQRSDTVISLARSVWKNNQPLDEVLVVNQNTGCTRDIIHRSDGGKAGNLE